MVNPTPTIALDGEILSCAIEYDPDDGAIVLSANRLTLMGAMSIDWGRDNMFDQPDPSVLSFELFDPTGVWLGKLRDRAAIGRPVAVSYRRPRSNTGGTDERDRYLFQGFTTNVDVTAARQRTTAGTVDGWRVQIQATDRSGWLGNIDWNAGELPEESMKDRAVRIRNQAGPAGIRQFYFEDGFKDGIVGPLDVTDSTVLDTVNDMYTSFADQWTYNPDRNVLIRIASGSNFAAFYLVLATTGDDRAIRLGAPWWEDPTGHEDPIDEEGHAPGYVGSCDVAAELALSASTLTDITTISCTWHDKHNGYNEWTTSVHARDVTPRRLLKFESWYVDGIQVDAIIEDVRRYVTGEAATPMHPTIRWDTRVTGEIPTWWTFDALTLPAQVFRQIVVAGSPFTAALDLPPVWHPAGGQIVYDAGHWDITMHLAPSGLPLPDDFTPLTWGAFDNAHIGYGNYEPAEGDNYYHLDASISYHDLKYAADDVRTYD